jgi:hypothetical protein
MAVWLISSLADEVRINPIMLKLCGGEFRCPEFLLP